MNNELENIEHYNNELTYFKNLSEGLASDNITKDFKITQLNSELKHKREGFNILSDLQSLMKIETSIDNAFQYIVNLIGKSLGMNKCLILTNSNQINQFTPSYFFGYSNEMSNLISSKVIDFNTINLDDAEYLIVNSQSVVNDFIQMLKIELDLIYFICLPLKVNNRIIGYLITGRDKENKPFFQPLNNNDAITLKAITGVISVVVQNRSNLDLQKIIVTKNENETKILNLLNTHLSETVATELLKTDTEILGEQKELTIMFLDIRNFTQFSETRTPFEIVNYLNTVFNLIVDTITQFNGFVNIFQGDGLMAIFGNSLNNENHCLDSIQASFKIIDNINNAFMLGQIPETRIGIGIHSGPVIIGLIGSKSRKQYTVNGNTVILASRIEQLTKNFNCQILISNSLWEKINGKIKNAEPQYDVTIKGRTSKETLYKLL